ncbi:hypothetical protein AAFF_G00426470 [Aldrovandia affinis]|uniref:Uncharacterized protein n=1 Tax=Aldrovandia affinis TaxID=143900 RepID=A0AAD7S9U3_9TELE|nr:hypothetical protein AAFF_G00426470 [Aldrovandia affinis]
MWAVWFGLAPFPWSGGARGVFHKRSHSCSARWNAVHLLPRRTPPRGARASDSCAADKPPLSSSPIFRLPAPEPGRGRRRRRSISYASLPDSSLHVAQMRRDRKQPQIAAAARREARGQRGYER